MAGAKEIRSKIQSVKNTQKITRAMEMVAASKMRKAQDRMRLSQPFAEKMYNIIHHVAHSHSEYHHIFMQEREIKRVGYIVVSTDRGLCGGLNINLFKSLVNEMRDWDTKGVEVDLCLIGRKAELFFKRFGANVSAVANHLGDVPNTVELRALVKVMLESYAKQKIDRLFIIHNEFVNTMSQKPITRQLLPLPASNEKELKGYWDYIYEPDAKLLLDELLRGYIDAEVYQAVVANIACEQSARMVAMKSASDNAGDLIDKFQLAYNKARQAAITQELSEIVGGAAAV